MHSGPGQVLVEQSKDPEVTHMELETAEDVDDS